METEDPVMTRRLATLFVDIAGSTTLAVRHPAEAVLGVVQCFASLVVRAALRHRGLVKDFEGDGVLLYFESARDAVEAALAIRGGLDQRRCETACDGGPATRVRMSLTVGDVAVGVVGPASHAALALVGPSVNVGARLLRALPPGGIAASDEAMTALRDEAPDIAGHFRLADPAFEVPGADGLTVAVYAFTDPATMGA